MEKHLKTFLKKVKPTQKAVTCEAATALAISTWQELGPAEFQ